MKFILLTLFLIIGLAQAQVVDHGIMSPVSESRGVIAHRTAQGEPIIITTAQDRHEGKTRNSLLIINAKTGETKQYWHPDPAKVSRENYASMLASNGKFYTMWGDVFLEFDLEKRAWTFQQKIEGRVMSFAEDANGVIYFANFPTSTLYSFNPQSRALEYLGQLDEQEQYPFSLAAGMDGWIYAGIGTTKNNIVAFHPATKRRVQLIDESKRQTGDGFVFTGADGNIYATHLKNQTAPYFQLKNGQAIEQAGSTLPPKLTTGYVFWQHRIADFRGGGAIKKFVLRDKTAQIEDEQGRVHNITFDYLSDGAGVSSLALGPDGAIWGSTSHPLRLWRFDPATKTLGDWKGMAEIYGGNFPNLVTIGNNLYGALYNGGMVWRFDASRPWAAKDNPLQIGKFAEIARPRVAIKTADEKTLIFAGYPGYGQTGGELVFVDVATEKATVVKVQDQLPGLSTIAMRALPDGTLVGGTSTAAPGGGKRLAEKAALYVMDGATRKVIFQTIPVESGADIVGLEVGPSVVYGVTSDSQLFAFDPKARKVLQSRSLKEFGEPLRPGQSLVRTENGQVYGVFSNAVFRIDENFQIAKVSDLPQAATAGIAFASGRLYFACGARLCSVAVE